jgi:preprotein translocase SecE subunit
MARQGIGRSPLGQPAAAARRRLFQWRFFAEVWAELTKAEWPTRQEATRLTGIVIALSAVVAAILSTVDMLFNIVTRTLLGT